MASYSNDLNWIHIPDHKEKDPGKLQQTKRPKKVKGIKLIIEKGNKPLSVKNVLTGKSIGYQIKNDELTIAVPTFQDSGLIEIVYSN